MALFRSSPDAPADRPAAAPPDGVARTGAALLWTLIAMLGAIEAVLWGADLGLWGHARLRQNAYDWGGFWPGLLTGWRPNYSAQPYAMYITYALLHGGIVHFLTNAVTLWTLGRAVIERVRGFRFFCLYWGCALGGAAGYGLLAQTVQPMVGASGALFGLAGALMAWAYVDRFIARAGLWPIARFGLLLVAINLAMYWALDGQLAWQTHLGGFVTGWILALLIDPRSRALEEIS